MAITALGAAATGAGAGVLQPAKSAALNPKDATTEKPDPPNAFKRFKNIACHLCKNEGQSLNGGTLFVIL